MAPTILPGESALAFEGHVTLWFIGRDDHAIECLAQRHPLGLELSYVMNERVVMSRVFDTWERVFSQAVVWRDGVEQRGFPAHG